MYISSDSNIWIDFSVINRLKDPFRLGDAYCISRGTFDDELLEPDTMRTTLLDLGLNLVEIETDELQTAMNYTQTYPRLSILMHLPLRLPNTEGGNC